MDREDIMAKIGWALYDGHRINLVERKLRKMSNEELDNFSERIDELDLKEVVRARLYTLIFGALGVARFMTGHKIAGWIRLSLPILFASVLIGSFLIPKKDIDEQLIAMFVKIAILFCIKVSIIILWIWDFIRIDVLVDDYNFYQIMDLIKDVENGDENE